jgi:purine-cytosine permease-like protein
MTDTVATPRTRTYNKWAKNDTLEDYSLRYAPRSFRKWSMYQVATAALGGIAYLADFAIGGSVAIAYGFSNALAAIIIAAVIIFLTSVPIAYYSSKYKIDMDLLTRGAGFGYLGSTLTSVIYASFTFIFFSLEGSVMAQAITALIHTPLRVSYLIASLIIIPFVIFGMTLLAKLQVWTMPLWLILLFGPFIAVGITHPSAFAAFTHFGGNSVSGSAFTLVGTGAGAGVILSLIAQIGEQVDFLRFMPDKQLGGAFLAFFVASKAGLVLADEPIQQYEGALRTFIAPAALGVGVLFVVLSQIKINVTNAYSGSLSWSNFFSRILHWHPGRVVWIFLNVGIALTLMEANVFSFLNNILGFYSNVAIAWIGAVCADLVIIKPLGLSPSFIEFKRAHLYNFNPVGFGSMVVASVVSIIAFYNAFGADAKAFSPLIALVIAMILAPLIAWATGGKTYIARVDALEPPIITADGLMSAVEMECVVCGATFERPDMAACPFHSGVICSLCCSLDSACHDTCKKGTPATVDLGMPTVG